jgi:hypothetical protein
MIESGNRRGIRRFDRWLSDLAEGGSPGSLEVRPGPERALVDMLVSGGPELPAANRLDALKATYLGRGTSLREKAIDARVVPMKASRTRIKAHHALARVAAVATIIMALMVGLGLGSAYAMPGNPLYSVKLAAESAYVNLVPGDQNKADAYASYTSRRLNDLRYVEERGMSEWYYPLANDAEGGIGNAYGHGKRLRSQAAQQVTQIAQALTLRLEGLLYKAVGKMTPLQRAAVESGLERVRLQLRMRKGSSPGPSQQNGQPGSSDGQRNGVQNSAPGGPQPQPGNQWQNQQQQNQQGQPGGAPVR